MRKSLQALAILTLLPVLVGLAWGICTGETFSWTSIAAMTHGGAFGSTDGPQGPATPAPLLEEIPPEVLSMLERAGNLPADEAVAPLRAGARALEGDPWRPALQFAAALRAREADRGEASLELLLDPGLRGSRLGGHAGLVAGGVALEEEDPGRAAEILNRTAGDWPGTVVEADARLQRVRALLEAKDGEAALEEVDRLEAFAPALLDEDEILFLRARSYYARGNRSQAHDTLDSLWFHHPTSRWNREAKKLPWRRGVDLTKKGSAVPLGDRLARAEHLYRARWYRSAQREYGTILAHYPGTGDPDLMRLRAGVSAYESRRWDTAVRYLDAVSGTRPELLVEALYHRGLVHRRRKRTSHFLKDMQRASSLDATGVWRARAQLAIGEHYEGRGDLARARDAYAAAGSAHVGSPDSSEALWRLGWVAYQQYDFDQAHESFLALGETGYHPHERAAGLYWAAKAEAGRGQEPARLALLERVIDEYPNDFYGTRARQRLGRAIQGTPVSVLPAGPSDHLRQEMEGLARRVAGDPDLLASIERLRDLMAIRATARAQRELDWLEWKLGPQPEIAGLRLDLLGQSGDHLAALIAFRKTYSDFRSRLDIPAEHWQAVYPREFLDLVRAQAGANGLDPDFVLAVIHQESVFDPSATSSAGARGLMQIMPSTGKVLSRRLRERGYRSSRLYNPEMNVRYGTFYLADLLERFDGRPELALAGYNAGGGRVDRWMQGDGSEDPDVFVESIPFDETRNYVKRILNNVAVYKRLYGSAEMAQAR